MLTSFQFVLLIGLALLAWYWIGRMRSQELARATAKRACSAAGVQLLDDTVELLRLRVRGDGRGHPRFYREYRFEFTRDGSYRFRGEIAMLGPQILRVVLEGDNDPESLPVKLLH